MERARHGQPVEEAWASSVPLVSQYPDRQAAVVLGTSASLSWPLSRVPSLLARLQNHDELVCRDFRKEETALPVYFVLRLIDPMA